MSILPVGKLPADLLKSLLAKIPLPDTDLVLGPGLGNDCAVLDTGHEYQVIKSDPITFVTEAIGWYAVQISTNDIVTTGAVPRWMMAVVLLPERKATFNMAEQILDEMLQACQNLNIHLIGGHTEITSGLDRPILICTLIGQAPYGELVTPRGARIGDVLLLTKSVPIEGISVLVREFPELIKNIINEMDFQTARNFLYDPGIGIYKDVQIALSAGQVTAMHDPTEGGLLSALWELSVACGKKFQVDLTKVYVPRIAKKICHHLKINPLATLASGALLLAVAPHDSEKIITALHRNKIRCSKIGMIQDGEGVVDMNNFLLPWPERDELTKVFSV